MDEKLGKVVVPSSNKHTTAPRTVCVCVCVCERGVREREREISDYQGKEFPLWHSGLKDPTLLKL